MEEGRSDHWQKAMRFLNIGVNMNRIGKIELEGMRFWAFHGCLESEKKKGNLFMVDFTGELDMHDAAASDNLKDTVNYAEIYKIIKKEMGISSDLLEHVAGRIVQAIAEAYPEFLRFSVRISKHNPPVGGPVEWSKVTLSYNR